MRVCKLFYTDTHNRNDSATSKIVTLTVSPVPRKIISRDTISISSHGFPQSGSGGNLFSGWENIWIDPHGGSGGGVGADKADTSSSSSKPGQAQSMAKISVKRMPAEFRWFSSSCKSVNPMDGQILALDRPSLINRPPTPEPQPRLNQTSEPATEVESETATLGGSRQEDHGSTMGV